MDETKENDEPKSESEFPHNKKNKVVPLSIGNSDTKNNKPFLNKNKEIQLENEKNKEGNSSSTTSGFNSARTDQPLLMTPTIMVSSPMPKLVPISANLNKANKKLDPIKKKKGRSPTNKNKHILSGRLDANGYPIMKGGKNHRVTFKENLENVIVVESYKKYNVETTNANAKNCLKCLCVVF